MDITPKEINYSLKNCPIPNQESYLKSLIDKTEHFINRLRWKTIFFLKENEDSDSDSTNSSEYTDQHYGFPSPNKPPPVKELNRFESDLWNLVDSVTFSDKRSKFQKELAKDVNSICKSKNMIVPADKTRNLYEVKTEKYETLLKQNITALYRKTDIKTETEVNIEAKKLAEELDIADRIEVMTKTNAFITLKDHKPNFQNQTKCRLINPAKSELGKVSSSMLKEINAEVRAATELKQWRSTKDGLEWFEK